MEDPRTDGPGLDGGGEEPLNTLDLKLVRGALQRRASDVDEILQRLRLIPKILRAQNARLGSPLGEHALDDLAQDVFVIIWRKLEAYDGRKPIEAWAYRICRYELMNGVRRQSRYAMSDMHPDHPEGEEPEKWEFEEVHRGLETLPAEEASVVQLKHFEGLTFDEIGDRLSISANTAKTRYYRGLGRLEAFLSERARPGETPEPTKPAGNRIRSEIEEKGVSGGGGR